MRMDIKSESSCSTEFISPHKINFKKKLTLSKGLVDFTSIFTGRHYIIININIDNSP